MLTFPLLAGNVSIPAGNNLASIGNASSILDHYERQVCLASASCHDLARQRLDLRGERQVLHFPEPRLKDE
jgi:hypothetical protein